MSQRIALLAVVLAFGGLSVGIASPVAAAPATIGLRTGKNSKLSPRLATLASGTGFASPRAEARALSLPVSGLGSLITRPDGRVVVDIRTRDTTAGGVAELRDLGAQVENVSPSYSTVTAAVAPTALDAIASDPSVQYVMEVWAPHIGKVSAAQARAVAHAVTPQACAPTVSEGDSLMNVASARSTNHVNGSGETVGILSDSFNHAASPATTAAQDVAHGALPGPGNPCGHPDPVNVMLDGSGADQTDEGRAMAQLVHDLAPGADLAFSTVGSSETEFAGHINTLRAQAHPSVLVDDVFFPNEPFFQDGPVATSARNAVAAGVPYFTAAGNANVVVGGQDVASYEAPTYRGGACPTFTNLGYSVLDCHDFDPGAGVSTGDAITVQPNGGFDLDLQWAQPRGLVASDYDLFVVNGSGTIVAGSAIDNGAAGQPVEFLSWGNSSNTPQTVRIVIARFSGAPTAHMKFVFLDSGGITSAQWNGSNSTDTFGPGIVGHAGTSGVGTVGAIPYDDSTTPEDYSSHGPVTHYFQPVPSTTALGSPDVIAKPDFVATDGVRTSFFADQIAGVWRFYGTSAAAPQAAAIAADLRSKNPLLTPAQVVTAMHDNARPVTNNGTSDVVGGGYVDANAALGTVTALAGKPRAVGGTPGDGQVTVHWSAPASDGGIPITGYTVTPYDNNVAQTPLMFNSPATSQTITGLTNGTSFTYRVTAVDANGSGPDSDPSGVVVVGAPTKPTGVKVIAGGDGQVTLQWIAPASTNGAPISGNVITATRLLDDVDMTFSVGAVTSATVTQLNNGYAYVFRVVATNSRGNGEPSDPSTPFTVGLPGQVTHVAASPGNASAKVTYTAPKPNGTTIVSYIIEVYQGSSLYSEQNYSTATAQVVGSLVNGHAYKFRVHAVTNGGGGPESAFSPPIVAGAPAAPGSPSATAGNGAVALHWKPAVNNGSAITKYLVTIEVGGVAQKARTYSGQTTTAAITGLQNGKALQFTIQAVNARGSSRAVTSPAVVVGSPGPPTNVAAKPGHASATLTWTAPTTTNGAAITGYTVTPYRGGVALKPHVFHSAATKETVTGLGSGDTLTFAVAAINARGTGARSAKSKAILIN